MLRVLRELQRFCNLNLWNLFWSVRTYIWKIWTQYANAERSFDTYFISVDHWETVNEIQVLESDNYPANSHFFSVWHFDYTTLPLRYVSRVKVAWAEETSVNIVYNDFSHSTKRFCHHWSHLAKGLVCVSQNEAQFLLSVKTLKQ